MLSGQMSCHGRSSEAGRPHRRGVGRRWRRHRHHGDAHGRRGRRHRRRGEPVEGEPRRARRSAGRSEGLSVVPVAADASTDDGIATVIDQVRRTDGNLYGLVNIAGGAAPSTWMPSTRVTRDDWRALFTANLETAFFMSQAVAAEIRGAGQPGVDRVDLVDQRHEHRAVPHRLRDGQGRGGGDDPHDGGRTGAGQHPRQRRRAGRDRDGGVAHLCRRGSGAGPAGDRDGPARPARGAGRRDPVPALGPVELHHRPDPARRRRAQPQVDPPRRRQHLAVPQGRILPQRHQSV